MNVISTNRRFCVAVFGMGLLAGSAWLAQASPQEPAGGPPARPAQPAPAEEEAALRAELQQLQQRTQQIQARLDAIAQEAMQGNPNLQRKQGALQGLYREKLEEFGYPDEEDLQRLQAMQAQLQDPEALDAEERERLTRKFQQQVTELQQIQTRAREDEVVQERLQELQKARTEAMHEVDEETPALEKQLAEDQVKMQEMQQMIMMRQQQRPQQAPAR